MYVKNAASLCGEKAYDYQSRRIKQIAALSGHGKKSSHDTEKSCGQKGHCREKCAENIKRKGSAFKLDLFSRKRAYAEKQRSDYADSESTSNLAQSCPNCRGENKSRKNDENNSYHHKHGHCRGFIFTCFLLGFYTNRL